MRRVGGEYDCVMGGGWGAKGGGGRSRIIWLSSCRCQCVGRGTRGQGNRGGCYSDA